jgi:hypothetical protein
MLVNIILQALYLAGYTEYKEYNIHKMYALLNHYCDAFHLNSDEIIDALYYVENYFFDFNEFENIQLTEAAIHHIRSIKDDLELSIAEKLSKDLEFNGVKNS